MNSFATDRLRACFKQLPQEIQGQARDAYRRFMANPNHPGLRFKQVHSSLPVYSARISLDYRAVGMRDGDSMIWFWIGSHSDYNRLLATL